ncbi:hypothetical protein [Zooshikella sp. RANM57]|uniref:hypothetical protein n=1 Tax=Zooshikella sp. RANM57 TaxID=3425863 RepID=UPI003D6E8333
MKHIKYFLIVLVSTFPLVIHSANAANIYTASSHSIGDITFHSVKETIYPSTAGVVQVTFSSIAWNDSTNCNKRFVYIRNEDSHLVSAILTAYTAGMQIRIFVDDDLQADDHICYVRALKLVKG